MSRSSTRLGEEERWRYGARPHSPRPEWPGEAARPKEGARRLFMADALIEAGVDLLVILKGLCFEAGFLDEALEKYNPNQPRVPAGNPDGGQWTNGGWVAEIRDGRRSRPGLQIADASATRGRQMVSDATPVAYPGDFHDQIEHEQIDAYRKPGAQCVSEVRLQFGDVIALLDILCRTAGGIVLGVEIKTGDNPDFTPEQQVVYPHTLTGGLISRPDPQDRLPRDSAGRTTSALSHFYLARRRSWNALPLLRPKAVQMKARSH
jgi:hypothetical protein